MIEVFHVTAHLGGGVGKALSELVAATRAAQAPVRHAIACLEKPEKSQFVDLIERDGGEVLIAPDESTINCRLAQADIVQIEWWNHPATIACLASLNPSPIRLLVWCHVSGLCNPVIPAELIEAAHRFILTSPCSHAAPSVKNIVLRDAEKIGVISSAGGTERLPETDRANAPGDKSSITVGYLGSLNFAKLHPEFVPWAAAVRLPGFRVRLIGDPVNQETLKAQAVAHGRPDLFEFRGYTGDVARELASLDVLAYLLNPRHYGTAENALVEAMAMGVVPVVLDNPAERCIVEDGVTGIVISSGRELADALDHLARSPEERRAMGSRASREVRRRFSSTRMEAAFREQYLSLIAEPKRPVPFDRMFGNTPGDWFLSCQGESALYNVDGRLNVGPGSFLPHDQFERSKGSVFHFAKYFPYDPRLRAWSSALHPLAPYGIKNEREKIC